MLFYLLDFITLQLALKAEGLCRALDPMAYSRMLNKKSVRGRRLDSLLHPITTGEVPNESQ